MRTTLGNFGCFILFILFLPLFAIVIGPLLILAALRGYQPLGPITMDTVRYGPAGRVGAFMLGLALWLLIWASLIWLALANVLPGPTVANIFPLNLIPPTSEPVAMPTPPASTFTPVATFTPTSLPATATPTERPTLPAPTPTATPTATPTELFNETLATNTPTSTPELGLPVAKTRTPTPIPPPATLTAADRQAIIATVQEGNLLLRNAIALANEENIQELDTVWYGRALEKAERFATELYDRYAKPFQVELDYITPPTIDKQRNELNEIVVVSREKWSYKGRTQTNQEAFEFIYALNQIDGRWVITRYTYRNLSGDRE